MFENYEYKDFLIQALNMNKEEWEEFLDRKRIWSNVNIKSDIDACWEWTGCKDKRTGYGVTHYHKVSVRAHRAIYEIECGKEENKNLIVRHKCDNTNCVNPNHLEIGTQLDNAIDRINRQNNQRGENNYYSKLTSDNVKNIRERHKNGEMQKDLAKEYNVNAGTISQIINGWTWKDGFIGDTKKRKHGKLSKEEVLRIIDEYNPTKTSQNKLARKYGISRATVRRILIGDYLI